MLRTAFLLRFELFGLRAAVVQVKLIHRPSQV